MVVAYRWARWAGCLTEQDLSPSDTGCREIRECRIEITDVCPPDAQHTVRQSRRHIHYDVRDCVGPPLLLVICGKPSYRVIANSDVAVGDSVHGWGLEQERITWGVQFDYRISRREGSCH